MAAQNERNKGLNASHAGTVILGDATINRMAFGTMRLPGPSVWGEPRDPQEARRVLGVSISNREFCTLSR